MTLDAKISPTGAVYYTQDGNHNVTTITDDTGAVVERYSYDVYGAATITDGAGNVLTVSGVGNRFMFTGRETSDWREEVGLCSSTAREGERRGHARVQFITEIGIYDYRNRVYSAHLGRFLQTDPIRFQAGDINIYRYVGNGPVNGTDPSGEICWGDVFGGVGGALMGSAAGEMVGTAIGAIIGSAVGPAGTVIGAGVGAELGSFTGGALGGYFGGGGKL